MKGRPGRPRKSTKVDIINKLEEQLDSLRIENKKLQYQNHLFRQQIRMLL